MNIELKKECLWCCHTSLEVEDGTARVSKIEKLNEDDTNSIVLVDGPKLKNGTIDIDVCGKLRPDAPAHARGFIGIVFRVNDAENEFESFYIRPTNGRGCEDPVRREHGCQYFAYPGYTFSYFREFGIKNYEHHVDTIALGEWAHIKAVLFEDRGDFFVNGEHVLTVQPMLHDPQRGAFGLYVDIGTDGYFRNLEITEAA